MIFIIGVNHEIQYMYNSISVSTEKFQEYLKTKAINRNVTLIAEELSKEAIIRRQKATDSVARVVASSLDSTNHQFCDPDSETRESMGISDRQIKKKHGLPETGGLSHQELEIYDKAKTECDRIKEKHWFSLIKDHVCLNVIFICGDSHVENFKELVTKEGYPAEVLSTNWKIE